MEKRTIFLLTGIVLIAVLILALYNLTGFAVKEKGICTDTDKGLDKYVKGTAKYANMIYTFTDFCVRSAKLREYFCGPGNISLKYKKLNCEKGCVDGACTK